MKKVLIVLILVLAVMAGIWFYKSRRTEPGEELGEKAEEIIREPAVAGAFYPGSKETLESQIDEFFAKVPEQEIEGELRVLIVPHAGYVYSGQVAAFGFKQLQGKTYSTVVIIGISHQGRFEKAAVFEHGVWETPLGKVGVDSELAQKLIQSSHRIVESSSIHETEHSLEVELPFLQKALKNFKIVPILLGSHEKELVDTVAQALYENIDDSTLLVVSTDLSHYPPYEDANAVDKKTIDAVLTGDIEKLEAAIAESMASDIPNLATCMCGEGAVKVGMLLAKRLGAEGIKLLKYANSGDTAGERGQVVGYAAIGFFEKSKVKSQKSKLQLKAQKELLRIARETLGSYLTKKEIPKFEIDDEGLNEKLGAFVTLRKEGNLRGCIGRFEPDIPLWKVVQEMTVAAATSDTRFLPVTASELVDIKIEISVLSPKQKIEDPGEIKLGEHGVVLQKGQRSGVFLPQVATETGWGFEEFMGQLCSQKAGLSWDCWKDPSVNLYTFTTQVFEEE